MGDGEENNLDGMRLYTAWHLNLNYSSIESNDHPKVIATCYWPILDIAESRRTPFGIEINGASLEAIEMIDPSWIRKAVSLAREGLVEFIGSGYTQIIGPLTPYHINVMNFVRGQEIVEDLTGIRPRVAYVNEQSTSSGVLEAIANSGFDAAVVEWENAWIANPEWPEFNSYRPQRVNVADGLGIIWNHSRYFQGLQRVVHRELTVDSYLDLFRKIQPHATPAICFYGGDAETFDFRPGRFPSESKIWTSEWGFVSDVIGSLVELGGTFILPGELLDEFPDQSLEMFNAGNQIITKKQAKYNPTRWAVGGRENFELNNYSVSLAEPGTSGSVIGSSLSSSQGLRLWSSDLRTHITDSRWQELITEHPNFHQFSARNQPDISAPEGAECITDEFKLVKISTGSTTYTCDISRGLTINSLSTNCECQVNLVGRLPFGSIDGPGHSPDWYTGNVLFQEPGRPQDTELSSGVSSTYWRTNSGQIFSKHDNHSFSLAKRFQRNQTEESISLEYRFNWKERPRGITRAGFITFLPHGWDWGSLMFSASNGGSTRSSYSLGDKAISHGAPVSPLVSASGCVGLTDGGFSVSDGRHEVDVMLKDYSRGAVALLDYHPGPRIKFLRVSFSLQEIDDTSRPRLSEETAFGISVHARCLSDDSSGRS